VVALVRKLCPEKSSVSSVLYGGPPLVFGT
jgi:hypothetical protein